jgi:hypothetical protein
VHRQFQHNCQFATFCHKSGRAHAPIATVDCIGAIDENEMRNAVAAIGRAPRQLGMLGTD